MDWGGPDFVIAIIAISTFGWIANNWVRAKHGYELEDKWGGRSKNNSKKSDSELRDLRAENAKLIALLEDQGKRMETLERIVTDKGYRLKEEIEALRDLPDAHPANSSVQLDLQKKESA